MKKSILVVFLFMFLCGCAGCAALTKFVDQLPEGSAEEVYYNHTTDVSSAYIKGTGYNKTEEEVTFETLEIKTNYPWLGATDIKLNGYKRIREQD